MLCSDFVSQFTWPLPRCAGHVSPESTGAVRCCRRQQRSHRNRTRPHGRSDPKAVRQRHWPRVAASPRWCCTSRSRWRADAPARNPMQTLCRRRGISPDTIRSQSPGNVSYCATKSWMNSFTEGIDLELRGTGSPVRVQALCPGFTVTGFHDTMGVDRKDIPAFLWMGADEVVETSLRALDRGTVIVIPGWKYKLAAAFLRHMPWAIRRRASRP